MAGNWFPGLALAAATDISTVGLIGADDAGLMFSDDSGWIA